MVSYNRADDPLFAIPGLFRNQQVANKTSTQTL